MDFSLYRNDLLTKGAILGCVMLVSNIAETAMFYYGGLKWMMPLALEMLVMAGVYIYLVYRFTKNFSLLAIAERENLPYFTYGEGVMYAMNLSGLAGIVVALGGYVFMHYVIGYENFIAAYIKLFQEFFSQVPMASKDADMLRELFTEMQKAEEPTILANLLSSVSRYIMIGALVGLVVAAFTKRNIILFDTNNSNNEDEEPKDE